MARTRNPSWLEQEHYEIFEYKENMLVSEAMRETWCKIPDVIHLCVIFHTNIGEEQGTYLQAL